MSIISAAKTQSSVAKQLLINIINIDIKFSSYDTFLQRPSSRTLKAKPLERRNLIIITLSRKTEILIIHISNAPWQYRSTDYRANDTLGDLPS